MCKDGAGEEEGGGERAGFGSGVEGGAGLWGTQWGFSSQRQATNKNLLWRRKQCFSKAQDLKKWSAPSFR